MQLRKKNPLPQLPRKMKSEDYGYDTPIEQQTVVGESLLHARANRARVEALNYLDDREKDLQILSGYWFASAQL